MPGRARIMDLVDADAGSPRYCGHSIGRVIQVELADGPGWLRIDRIERSGAAVWGVGEFVPASQAVKIQTKWDIRWGLRCAPVAAPAPDRPPSAGLMKFADVDGAAAAIVNTGYRELAKRHHPDTGGSHQSMSLLTQAKSQLSKILELAKGSGI